jgi:hypothetical protein
MSQGLNRQHPVVPEIERQLIEQPVYQRRTVLIEKRHETDRALLRMAAGEGERLWGELPAQCFVAPLRRLDRFPTKRLRSCCIPPSVERRAPSVGSARAASARRVIAEDRLRRVAKACSTVGGICAVSRSLSAASSRGRSAASGRSL